MKKKGFNITKINKNLKTADSILAFSNVAAYVIGGKIKFLILISILLVTYAIYIRFYPYIYIETRTKKTSVIFAVLAISFSIVLPLNVVLTFDKPVHETVTITDKDVNTGDNANSYLLYGNWKGEEAEFNVSRSTYKETSIGDVKKICIRKSVLGLEYYTIHK